MPRAIDHVVHASRDLAAQAEFYRRLGFTLGARNHHPWGTENHIIQFADHFIELISRGPGFRAPVDLDPHTFSFAGFVSQQLEKSEGVSMLAFAIGLNLATVVTQRGNNNIFTPTIKSVEHIRPALNTVLLAKLLKCHSHIIFSFWG